MRTINANSGSERGGIQFELRSGNEDWRTKDGKQEQEEERDRWMEASFGSLNSFNRRPRQNILPLGCCLVYTELAERC